MKIIIAGGRDFNNHNLLKTSCDKILSSQTNVEIVSGTAMGADKLGEQYAKEKNYPIKMFPADWDKYGKSAGHKRNTEMADYADALILFWNGFSKGSKHMLDIAQQKNLKVRVICYN